MFQDNHASTYDKELAATAPSPTNRSLCSPSPSTPSLGTPPVTTPFIRSRARESSDWTPDPTPRIRSPPKSVKLRSCRKDHGKGTPWTTGHTIVWARGAGTPGAAWRGTPHTPHQLQFGTPSTAPSSPPLGSPPKTVKLAGTLSPASESRPASPLPGTPKADFDMPRLSSEDSPLPPTPTMNSPPVTVVPISCAHSKASPDETSPQPMRDLSNAENNGALQNCASSRIEQHLENLHLGGS